ncbi:MAG: DMT family transporter [Pseudomonadota bacterium]
MQTAKTMDRVDWGLLLLLALLWGGAYFFVGVAVRELPPLTVVLLRVAIAACVMLPVVWWLGQRLPTAARAWLPFLGMGLLNNVLPFSLIFYGQTHITVGLSSVINALTPLFTVLVMAGFREERLTAYRVLGVVLGVVGVAVLRGAGYDLADAQVLGIGLCMAAALSYGFAGLWGRRYLATVPPVTSATCQLICSAAVMACVVAVVDRPWELGMPSVAVVWAILALAVLGTALAYIVFFTLLVRAGASNVMLVTLLIPVIAIALGAVFLGEAVHASEVAGALVIGAGLLCIDGRLVSWWRRP